jgi:hypothetical protein
MLAAGKSIPASGTILEATAAARMGRVISFLPRLTRQVANYAALVAWLLHAVFKARATKLSAAVVLAGLHLAGQAAGIFAIYWYARQMDKNGTLSLPLLGIDFALKDEPVLLWAVVIFAVVSFAASSCSLFLSRQLILRIVEDYYAQSLERLVLVADRLPDPRARTASGLLVEYGLSGLTTGCRSAALTAVVFANAIPSAIGGVAAAIVLFQIDMPLTPFLLAAAAAGAILLYPLALRAVSMAKFRERAQAAFHEEVRRLRQLGPSAGTVASLATTRDLARGYFGRRRVTNEFVFAIGIGVTGLLGLVLYYMASRAMTGGADWAAFIAYIGALRLTLASGALVVQALASLTRYYPQIVRYYVFTHDADRLDKMPLGRLEPREALTLGTLPNGAEIVVTTGERLAVVTSEPMSELRFALLHARSSQQTPPLGTVMLRPANGSAGDATIAVADADQFASIGDDLAAKLDDLHADIVALIVYQTPGAVGGFGERHLLTFEAGTFRRFLPLGTGESAAVLEHYSRKAATKRGKSPFDADDDELDEE